MPSFAVSGCPPLTPRRLRRGFRPSSMSVTGFCFVMRPGSFSEEFPGELVAFAASGAAGALFADFLFGGAILTPFAGWRTDSAALLWPLLPVAAAALALDAVALEPEPQVEPLPESLWRWRSSLLRFRCRTRHLHHYRGAVGIRAGVFARAPDQDADPQREQKRPNTGDQRRVGGQSRTTRLAGRRWRRCLSRALHHRVHQHHRVHEGQAWIPAALPALHAVALVGGHQRPAGRALLTGRGHRGGVALGRSSGDRGHPRAGVWRGLGPRQRREGWLSVCLGGSRQADSVRLYRLGCRGVCGGVHELGVVSPTFGAVLRRRLSLAVSHGHRQCPR